MEPSPEDVILEEEIDPNYEPTEEELLEYATWLGMDLINHKNLLWIAKEALIAPLPNDWKPCLTEEDEIYYFNFTTGRSIWDHPCDEYYRKVYKEEVEKLNQLQLQQGNQAFSGSSPNPPGDQRSSPTVVESNLESLQKGRVGDSQSSHNSLERVSAREPNVDSKGFFMPSFPIDSPSSSKSNNATRSLPPPRLTGHPALLNLKGGSFDSTVSLYAASLAQNGGGMPLADLLRMREATGNLRLQRADISTSCVSTASGDTNVCREKRLWMQGDERRSTASGDTNVSREKRLWMQGDERRAFEKKISQIKDRIEKKLVDEERVVLQQERVEMLERVCKQVQEEESHILDSLRREIMERMERNLREESQALLAKRRKEIVEEVEQEIQVEKLVLRESQKNKEVNEEKSSLETDTRAMVSKGGMNPKESEASSSEAKKTNTCKGLIKTSLKQMEQGGEATHLNSQREIENVSKSPCLAVLGNGTQDMREPIRMASKILLDHGQEDGIRKDSSKKTETGCGEDERFEKSFHVQDLRTSLLLKLEVLMKIGTSND